MRKEKTNKINGHLNFNIQKIKKRKFIKTIKGTIRFKKG